MKKKLIKIFSLVMIMFAGMMTVDAASFSVSVGSKNITKGGSTKLTIKGSDVTGRFNISTSNSSVVSISDDRAWIENDSYSVTLSALSVGTSTITVTPSGVSDSNGNTASLGAKTIKITVSLPREKSKDNNLKSLSVDGFEISPAFDKNIQNYSVTVPEETKTVKINAVKNESHATVTGAGTVDVTSGTNTINVSVKSETGVEKVYTITVEVKDSNPIVVDVGNEEYTVVKLRENLTAPDFFEETTTTINDFEIPAYKNEKTGLVLVGLKDESGDIKLFIYDKDKNEYSIYNEIGSNKISIYPLETDEMLDGYTKGEIEINGNKVNGYYFNEDSRFAVLYGINIENGEKGFYLYDKEDQSLVKYNDEYINQLHNKLNLYSYIIIGFSVIFVLLLVVIIFKKPKKSKKNEPKVTKVTFDEEKNANEIVEIKEDLEEEPEEIIKEKKKKNNKKKK